MPWVESYLKRYAACASKDGRGVGGGYAHSWWVWLRARVGSRGRRSARRDGDAGDEDAFVRPTRAHVFDIAERIVYGDDLGAILHHGGAADETADAAEAGDTHFDHS